MALSLISVNVEFSKHLARVLPFLEKQQADVVCVQELLATDIPAFMQATRAHEYHYSPMTLINGVEWGVAIFSRYPVKESYESYYHGGRDVLVEYRKGFQEETESFVLRVATIVAPDGLYTIATTHFIWTPEGQVDDFQRAGAQKLLTLLEQESSIVLCGDFNAPRGGEIYQEFAERYTDNIPPHYKTSIDIAHHRNGKIRPHELADKMVDHLFTSAQYKTSDVALVSDVSDHMAIVAVIEKS